MKNWYEINQPYGKRHIWIGEPETHGCIEQYSDGRENPCEVWGPEETKPVEFPNLREARKYFKDNFVTPHQRKERDMRKVSKVVELDSAELAIRFMEIGVGLSRPEGKSAEDILKDVIQQSAGNPVTHKTTSDFVRMAEASIAYFSEQIDAAGTIQ